MHVADGDSATEDLLVGADGANSRVRELLTHARPAHTAHNVVEFGIPDIDRTHPGPAAMAPDAGRKMLAFFRPGCRSPRTHRQTAVNGSSPAPSSAAALPGCYRDAVG